MTLKRSQMLKSQASERIKFYKTPLKTYKNVSHGYYIVGSPNKRKCKRNRRYPNPFYTWQDWFLSYAGKLLGKYDTYADAVLAAQRHLEKVT